MIVLLLIFALGVFTLLADRYFDIANQSFVNASKTWKQITSEASKIIDDETYPSKSIAFVMVMTGVAGCGCFVRAMLINHYFPKMLEINRVKRKDENPFEGALDGLTDSQRKSIDKLIAKIIWFDAHRNPLHGLLFKRLLSKHFNGKTAEQELAAISVVRRKTQDQAATA